MARPTADYASDFTTLVAVVDGFEADGYTTQFRPCDDGMVQCLSCREEFPAARAKVDAMRRTEGASDPDDMAAVVALTCPECGSRGTLVLHFGPEASLEEQDVLAALHDERRLEEDRPGGGIGAGGGNDQPTA